MRIDGDAKLIAAAFVKARAAMNATVSKDGKGNYGKYATLAAIVEATAEHFGKHGLAIVQEASTADVGLVIETWLVHESGALMQFTPLTMPLSNRTPQAVGSAITYGRRYALAAVCGLAPDDDDGQAAQDAQPQARSAQNGHSARNGATHAQSSTQAPKTSQKPVTPATEDGGNPFEDEAQETPPHQRMWGIGQSTFGPDWDMARPWLLRKWTEAQTYGEKIRESAEDLNDTEKDLLADYIKEHAAVLQQTWAKQKAKQAMTKAQVQP